MGTRATWEPSTVYPSFSDGVDSDLSERPSNQQSKLLLVVQRRSTPSIASTQKYTSPSESEIEAAIHRANQVYRNPLTNVPRRDGPVPPGRNRNRSATLSFSLPSVHLEASGNQFNGSQLDGSQAPCERTGRLPFLPSERGRRTGIPVPGRTGYIPRLTTPSRPPPLFYSSRPVTVGGYGNLLIESEERRQQRQGSDTTRFLGENNRNAQHQHEVSSHPRPRPEPPVRGHQLPSNHITLRRPQRLSVPGYARTQSSRSVAFSSASITGSPVGPDSTGLFCSFPTHQDRISGYSYYGSSVHSAVARDQRQCPLLPPDDSGLLDFAESPEIGQARLSYVLPPRREAPATPTIARASHHQPRHLSQSPLGPPQVQVRTLRNPSVFTSHSGPLNQPLQSIREVSPRTSETEDIESDSNSESDEAQDESNNLPKSRHHPDDNSPDGGIGSASSHSSGQSSTVGSSQGSQAAQQLTGLSGAFRRLVFFFGFGSK